MVEATHGRAFGPRGVKLYSSKLIACWVALLCLAVLLEVLPNPLVAPIFFYSRLAIKICVILLLGVLTPLSFWRFDSLSLGVVFAFAAAALPEALQSFIQGHRSSWLELGSKVVLIFVGFAIGLNARYEQSLGVGALSVPLKDETHSK